MGTKDNPGEFNCYAKAEPDEPMFVLLARDPLASVLVDLWAALRSQAEEDLEKTAEATVCATQMRHWRASGRGPN